MGPIAPDQVAVGIIQDDAGRVLIARRPASKPGGGLWEFPGGKVQAGESPHRAVQRELEEELGIVAEDVVFLPHFRGAPPPGIDLSFWRVQRYRGEPYGREGQDIQWCALHRLPDFPFLSADLPIVARLRLPPLYLISDVDRLGEEEFERRLRAALSRGARLLQLREPWPVDRLREYANRLRGLCEPFGAWCVVNGDPVALEGCGDGVHLSSARLAAASVRPRPRQGWVGASCHSEEDLRRAEALGCDFAVLSPVQWTRSHPDREPLGWSRFRAWVGAVRLPVYALGGLSEADLCQAYEGGGQGVALRSAVFGDVKPE